MSDNSTAPTLRTVTLGCKVNQYETQYVREGLSRLGYRDAVDGEAADLCVVNSCTVTAEGDRVVVEWEGRATLKNGEPYHNQYVMVFTMKDGKIAQLNEYFCSKLAEKALFPLVAAGF